jgi:CRISPR-associated protein Csb2
VLAIEVEYLLGRSVATDVSQRDKAEWPPHPSRLFSALVDALADVGVESSAERAKCESALRWLEALPPPEIAASVDDDISQRTSVKYWVPINDETAGELRSAPLVEQRKRQERFFPATVPMDPVVVFAWPNVEPEAEHHAALDRLVARIPYLGHSSSVVRVALRNDAPTLRIAPMARGDRLLRVAGPGRLARLTAVHELRKSDTLVQPPKGREVWYGTAHLPLAQGPHGPARIVAVEGVSLGLEDTAPLVSRYRAALLSLLGDGSPPVLTGHVESGAPTSEPHIAYAPLANVDHSHADGSIKGIAVVLPRDMNGADVRRLESAMGRLRTLHFGARGNIATRLLGTEDELKSLDFRRYTRAATTWASVTPVALSAHSKPKKGLTDEAVVLRDLQRLGLPCPAELHLQNVSYVRGGGRAGDSSRRGVSSITGRLLRHVFVRFPERVQGPLLVGAGRYMGFGLLLPRS